jgi:hypothetical protein
VLDPGGLVCVNAQVMYYPTKVGTMRGTLSTPEERAKWPASEKRRFDNLKGFFDKGIDPYAVMLAEAYLLNFFTSREEGANAYEPPFEVLRCLAQDKSSAPVLN